MKILAFILSVFVLVCGCAKWPKPKMVVVTGTTLGFHVTPGDLSTQPPQLVLAFKRAEVAVVPTGQQPAVCESNHVDCFSTLAAFNFETTWTEFQLQQFISTGFAARSLATNVLFGDALTNVVRKQIDAAFK